MKGGHQSPNSTSRKQADITTQQQIHANFMTQGVEPRAHRMEPGTRENNLWILKVNQGTPNICPVGF